MCILHGQIFIMEHVLSVPVYSAQSFKISKLHDRQTAQHQISKQSNT